jgi:hypothetical protein
MNYSATNYVQCAEPGTASELQLTPLTTPDRREPDIAEEGSPVTQAATKKNLAVNDVRETIGPRVGDEKIVAGTEKAEDPDPWRLERLT